MDEFNEWRLVNLFLPALLPLVILSIGWFFAQKGPDRKKTSPWVAVKDGQLFWVALGYACAGIFELHHPTSCANIKKGLFIADEWMDIAAILLSGFMAGIAPTRPTGAQAPAGWFEKAVHFRIFLSSVAVVVGCAALYEDIHLTAQVTPDKICSGSGAK